MADRANNRIAAIADPATHTTSAGLGITLTSGVGALGCWLSRLILCRERTRANTVMHVAATHTTTRIGRFCISS